VPGPRVAGGSGVPGKLVRILCSLADAGEGGGAAPFETFAHYFYKLSDEIHIIDIRDTIDLEIQFFQYVSRIRKPNFLSLHTTLVSI